MSYRWWVFIHLAGVFGFLASHGVSIAVSFRLRRERDASRINALLELSSRSITPFYISFGLLLLGGIVATFLGELWGFGWIWAAIGALVVVSVVMMAMASPYYKKVRFVSRAVSEGSEAVTGEQFDAMLRSRRPVVSMWIGLLGLVFILYLMLFKPTFGLVPDAPAAAPVSGPVVEVTAEDVLFTTDRLTAPASEPFSIEFHNEDSGVPHNVAIYTDASASEDLFVGEIFSGPMTRVYEVPALEAGTHFFVCDVHPKTMTGTFAVE